VHTPSSEYHHGDASPAISLTDGSILLLLRRVFAGVRKPVDFESVAAAHERIRPIRLDVSDAASVAAAAREVATMLGGAGLDGLVNNAGVALIAPLVQYSPLRSSRPLLGLWLRRAGLGTQELMPEEEFARVFDVNVTGPLRVTQQFLPLLRTAKGRIVNMGSQVCVSPHPHGRRRGYIGK
jgi:NAD(P)-dependent dehydrogenase (short-subunit alcohol dehydrogenase family)